MYSCMAGGMDRLVLPLHFKKYWMDSCWKCRYIHLITPYCCLSPHCCCFWWQYSLQSLWNRRKPKRWRQPFPWRTLHHAAFVRHTYPYKLWKVRRSPSQESTGKTPWRIQISSRPEILLTGYSLHSKDQFPEFSAVMEEYLEMQHAELVLVADLQKLPEEVFYLPIHAVRKEHSTTPRYEPCLMPLPRQALVCLWMTHSS